jgi:hypothetical protein
MTATFDALIDAGAEARYRGDFATAEAAFCEARKLRPDSPIAAANLGIVYLAQGRYAEGWPLYEARKSLTPGVASSSAPEWRGEPLAGKRLLIWPEQGYGDQIQMARYAAVLRDAGTDVVLACDPPLARLFGSLGVEVVATGQDVTFDAPDYYCMAMSLPGLMGTTLQTIPPAPYLAWPARPRSGGIGVVWRGNPEHPNDRRRSLPSAKLLDPLRDVAELVDLTDPVGDFADAAARIQGLDLVISVDTAMAHLAGALGVPCWVLLPDHWTDWRWMRGRSDTPWYASLRLYRQPAPGLWALVVDEVRRDLKALMAR